MNDQRRRTAKRDYDRNRRPPRDREEINARQRAWYAENREQINARRAFLRRMNPERYRARDRAYYRANRTRILEALRQRRRAATDTDEDETL